MNDYIVSIPLNDTQDYDLVVDNGKCLYKVQCKATGYKRDNSYVLDLKSEGGTNGSIYKRLSDTNVDFLFVLCEDGTMYLIPKDVIKTRSEIRLFKEKSKFSQKTTLDTSKYIVTY